MILTEVCNVCGQPLFEEESNSPIRWNNDKEKHPYNFYCSNVNCGIKCIRMMTRQEYDIFYVTEVELKIEKHKERMADHKE